MKRAASALALGILVAVCAVAAPALSLAPYRPEPVDFELAPPPGAEQARPNELVSRPLSTSRRFNLVGIHWRGESQPDVAVRARLGGGAWSPWRGLATEAEDGPDPGSHEDRSGGVSSPAWVGEADQVQYRVRGRAPGLRLKFVNVRGTATAADRVRSALRRTASSAVSALGATLGLRAASAQEPQPAIVPRSGWGSDRCPPRRAPSYGSVLAAHVHHTVSLNDYSPQEAPGIVLAICRYHRYQNGWDDIGYNFLVDKYGTLYEGRAGGIDRAVVGAQAQGYNSQTTGISNIGTHTSVPQSEPALQAMARLIRWKLPIHGQPTSGTTTLVSAGGSTNRYRSGTRVQVDRILGHRDTNSTACPGNALYGQLPYLRALAGGAAPAGNSTRLSAQLASRSVRYRRSARFTGRLVAGDGRPVGGAPIEAQVRLARRWATVARTSTDGAGAYTALVRMRVTRLLRVRFPGQAGLRPSATVRQLVAVRPAIAVFRPPRRGARGLRVPVRGRVTPAKRRLYLVLQQRKRGRNRRLGVKPLRTRRGRFRTSFVPARTGLYRFYVVAKADRKNARGSSRAYLVRVSRFSGGAAPRRR